MLDDVLDIAAIWDIQIDQHVPNENHAHTFRVGGGLWRHAVSQQKAMRQCLLTSIIISVPKELSKASKMLPTVVCCSVSTSEGKVPL